jgi:cell division protein FtsQ
LSATSIWHPSKGGSRPSDRALSVAVVARPWRRWLSAVVGLSPVGGAGWGVTHSRIFDLRSLSVSGNVHLTSSEVASIGDLRSRTNILWLSTGALKRRLERNPWIRDVRISRVLPSAVSIAIVERTPVAILARSRLLVSSDGVVLGPADTRFRLPLIEGDAGGGDGAARISPQNPALQIARALPESLVLRVASVGPDRSGGLVLTLSDGTVVLLGDAADAQAKAAALLSLLRWIERAGVRVGHIDVSVPTAPAILPAQR